MINANACSDMFVVDTGGHHIVNGGLMGGDTRRRLKIIADVSNAGGIVEADFGSRL